MTVAELHNMLGQLIADGFQDGTVKTAHGEDINLVVTKITQTPTETHHTTELG